MKNTIKPLAILSAAVLLACTTGCADTSWSFKTDKTTLSNGMYIYYTVEAYNEASSEISESSESSESSDVSIMEQKIDGKSSEEWMKEKAVEKAVEKMTLEKLASKNKIKIDEATLEAQSSYYTQMYQYGSSMYEQLGISEDSYISATVEYDLLWSEVFDSIYDEGGTKEVSSEDKEKYFKENYTDYFYISYSLTTTDDDGNTVDVDDTTLDTVKTNFAKYVDMINKQSKTTDDVVAQYKVDFDTETDPSYSGTAVLEDASLSDELKEAITDLKENRAAVTTINNTYYLIYKGAIADKVSTLEDDSVNSNVLHQMKDEEYEEYLDNEEKKLDYETNDACISKYTIQRTCNIIEDYING